MDIRKVLFITHANVLIDLNVPLFIVLAKNNSGGKVISGCSLEGFEQVAIIKIRIEK